MGKSKKFYAVRRGRRPGVYTDWYSGCLPQVDRVSSPIYLSFASLREAEAWYEAGPHEVAGAAGEEVLASGHGEARMALPAGSSATGFGSPGGPGGLGRCMVSGQGQASPGSPVGAAGVLGSPGLRLSPLALTGVPGSSQDSVRSGGALVCGSWAAGGLEGEAERAVLPLALVPETQPAPFSSGSRHVLRFDGSCVPNPGRGGGGAVLRDGCGQIICEVMVGLGERCTNNVAEYEGLIAGLRLCLRFGITEVDVEGASTLVCSQVGGSSRVRVPHLVPLHAEVQRLVAQFSFCNVRHVPQGVDGGAQALARRAVGLPGEALL